MNDRWHQHRGFDPPHYPPPNPSLPLTRAHAYDLTHPLIRFQACIDQNAIQDGLKVLPVNVMACRKMLVLCGPTYPTRLWCAWELFTLFSFQDSKQATNSIALVVLDYAGSRGGMKGMVEERQARNGLTQFDLNEAHTYDPNEEAKLR